MRDRADDRYEDYDDRPRSKKRRRRGNDNTILLIVGGVLLLGFIFVCAGGAAVVAIVLLKRSADRVLLDHAGNLTANDPVDPFGGPGINTHMKVFQVPMRPGKTYIITMDSEDFDAYLRVESPIGQNVAEDDDSGGNLNARIEFRPGQAGMFRVIATSFKGGIGRFRLKVQEAD